MVLYQSRTVRKRFGCAGANRGGLTANDFGIPTPPPSITSVVMSQLTAASSTTPNFQAIFYASLEAYEKKTKKKLLAHPLTAQLQTCNSPADILAILRAQVQQSGRSTSDEKLTRWLNPTVNVLYAFSAVLGEGVGLVCPNR